MTNQQGAPEALVMAARAVVEADDKQALNQNLIERLRAALVEAQQPAAHVQKPTEIEHDAGDVSQNGPKSNMAQQAAPSAAAAITDTEAFQNFHRLLCARFGYVHDERDWRRDQLSLVEHIARQVHSSPAPQADSQPAPVQGELLPCPCCGGEAAEHDRFNSNAVRCLSCGLRVKQSETGMGDAAQRWNSRAARAPTDSVTAPAGGIPGNFITHRAAWRKALDIAWTHATGDDVSYWSHELRAFDRSFDRLFAVMGADSAPVGRECCNEHCAWVGSEGDCVHPKHDPSQRLCPKCNEVTEPAA